ncbi:MAG: putative RNA uridine N3 methyltransferase [Halobacteriales archaeon]
MTLAVAIPASFVGETDDPRIRAYKIGQVARAAAVFRCDRVAVYDDDPDDGDEIGLVLRYTATAPYLRKEEFDVRDELAYAGVVPPLGIPTHRAGSDPDGSEPEYRQGVVTRVEPDGRIWVECGTRKPVALHVPEGGIREGERVTIRLSRREPINAEVVDADDVEAPYTGFEVERTSLTDLLASFEGEVVCTSRQGAELSSSTVPRLRHEDALYVFGSPYRGVKEILRDRYDGDVEFDDVVNTLPRQGAETVRTEEAVWATLALVNVARQTEQE